MRRHRVMRSEPLTEQNILGCVEAGLDPRGAVFHVVQAAHGPWQDGDVALLELEDGSVFANFYSDATGGLADR